MTYCLAPVQLGQQGVKLLLREVLPLHVAQQHHSIRPERVQRVASLLQAGLDICRTVKFLNTAPQQHGGAK